MHPGIGMHLHEESLDGAVPMLRSGELDLCFALADPDDLGEAIDGDVLLEEELVVGPRRGSSARGHGAGSGSRDRRRAADPASAPAPRCRGRSTRSSTAPGRTPTYAFETLELEMMRSLASRGLGVALLPSGYLLREGPPVVAVRLRPRVHLPVSLLWRSDRRLPRPPRRSSTSRSSSSTG